VELFVSNEKKAFDKMQLGFHWSYLSFVTLHHLGFEKLEEVKKENLTTFVTSLSHQGLTLLSFA
jgi:hypothetical protein